MPPIPPPPPPPQVAQVCVTTRKTIRKVEITRGNIVLFMARLYNAARADWAYTGSALATRRTNPSHPVFFRLILFPDDCERCTAQTVAPWPGQRRPELRESCYVRSPGC